MGDMDCKSNEKWRRHYGESLTAGSLTKDGEIQLDNGKRLTSYGTFYKSRLVYADMPLVGLGYISSVLRSLQPLVHSKGGVSIQ